MLSHTELSDLVEDRFTEFEDEFQVKVKFAINTDEANNSFFLDLGFENLPIITDIHLLRIKALINWIEKFLVMDAEVLHQSKVGRIGLFFYFKEK